MHKSKYINKKYSGWKVVGCESTPDKHLNYTLTKNVLGFKRTMTLRDNAIRQLDLNKKSIKDFIRSKRYLLSKNINPEMNSIKTTFSLF